MTHARLWLSSFAVLSAAVLIGCNEPKKTTTGTAAVATPPVAAQAGSSAAVAPKAGPPATEVVLFGGKNLDAWTVTECETEIKDGVLLLKAGEGWIRTNKQYTNFELQWDCRNLKKTEYDSGVHFRAELPAPKAHWPKKFQVNLKTDQEGNLTSVKEAASTGLYKNGEWNHFKLTVVGETAALEINDKPAWKTDKIDTPTGYIGLQSEVTLGGQFEFRDIKIKELP